MFVGEWAGIVSCEREINSFTASLVFLLGTCLLAFAQNLDMLLAGRFFLGAGLAIMTTGACW